GTFASLSSVVQQLGGVTFDIRGLVQLKGGGSGFGGRPVQVTGIAVAQTCKALHFLHAAAFSEKPGTAIGEYVIHYANKQQESVPLIYGENIADWSCGSGPPALLGHSTKIAWMRGDPSAEKPNRVICLYDLRWENRHPQTAFPSLDFKSAMKQSGPFLLAITLD